MLSHLNDARETLLLLLAIGMLQELMQTQSGKVRLPSCKGCAVPSCGGVLMKLCTALVHASGMCMASTVSDRQHRMQGRAVCAERCHFAAQ